MTDHSAGAESELFGSRLPAEPTDAPAPEPLAPHPPARSNPPEGGPAATASALEPTSRQGIEPPLTPPSTDLDDGRGPTTAASEPREAGSVDADWPLETEGLAASDVGRVLEVAAGTSGPGDVGVEGEARPTGAGDELDLGTAPAETVAVVEREAAPAPPRARAGGGPRTAAGWLARALRAAGLRYAFTVPGESFLPLLDALDEVGTSVVATRHEAGAGFMAEAYGQLTGRPAAAIVTRAVGASNLAIALHTAYADSAPLIAIVGQVERPFLGREAFQEVDLVGSIGALTKWAVEPARAAELPDALAEAVRQATTGRPGPVLLAIPADVFDEPLEAPVVERSPQPAGSVRPDPVLVRSILQLLACAERPVILAGGGVLRARCSTDLLRLAELLRVPIVAAWRRGDVVPNDHPLYLGMAGHGAPPTVRERLLGADAILVLGCRLNEVTTYGYEIPAPGTRWAHVDVEPRGGQAGLRRPDFALAADARAFLRAAVNRLANAVLDAAIADARAERNARDRAAFEAASRVEVGTWSGPGVHPGRVVATLRRVLPDTAILTTDAGNFAGWAARGFRFRRPGTFLGPTSGAMGYGLPAAIAAALIHRDRPVVALVGDGGMAMSMAELETAVRERVRPIVLVFDNERYGMIRMHQDERAGSRAVATDLGPIDFAAIGRALGGRGVRIESDTDFEPALREALGADRPTVLHLVVDRRWVSVNDHPFADREGS